MKKITAQGLQVAIFSQNEDDYISLTDVAKYKDKERTEYLIQNWIRNKNTIEFLGIWESINNPNFKHIEFDVFKNLAGSNSFSLTPKRWIEGTKAFGIINKSGHYGGGTFAHKDIAFEFASWISPEFKLYLIKEFQRLKVEESKNMNANWSAKRLLTKINYKIHTDAIKEKIILPKKLSGQDIIVIYASEADILNKALFNMTASEWKINNKDNDGNIRDYADVYQLVVLANLENLNAEYIKEGLTQKNGLLKLNISAISQMKSLLGNVSVKKLGKNV